MSRVFLFSLTSAFNPTLMAATTLMLLLPHPKRLMLGYLLGALTISITLGVIIVAALEGSGAVNTTQRTLSPVADVVLGTLALVCASLLASDRADRVRERRQRGRSRKGPPRWQRTLSKGSARTTFVLGVLLTLPGASYLAGLHHLNKLGYPIVTDFVVIVGFNLIMLILLELPLLSFVIAPEWTPGAIDRAKAWIAARWRRIAVRGLLVVGAALIAKGIVELVA